MRLGFVGTGSLLHSSARAHLPAILVKQVSNNVRRLSSGHELGWSPISRLFPNGNIFPSTTRPKDKTRTQKTQKDFFSPRKQNVPTYWSGQHQVFNFLFFSDLSFTNSGKVLSKKMFRVFS